MKLIFQWFHVMFPALIDPKSPSDTERQWYDRPGTVSHILWQVRRTHDEGGDLTATKSLGSATLCWWVHVIIIKTLLPPHPMVDAIWVLLRCNTGKGYYAKAKVHGSIDRLVLIAVTAHSQFRMQNLMAPLNVPENCVSVLSIVTATEFIHKQWKCDWTEMGP